MSASSGQSDTARALLTLRRTSIDLDDLLDAIDHSWHRHPEPGVALRVEDRHGPNPVVEVTEAERRVRISVLDLVRDMETARIPNQRHMLAHSFRTWLNQRPVPDAVAADHGIVVPTWADTAERRVAWTVVVRRPDALVDWVPSFRADSTRIKAVRAAAWDRARTLPMDALRAGDVTVWIHAANPGLSTAILTNPERVTAHQPLVNPHLVFSPGRPVVSAERAAAVRLTEETSEPHIMMPLNETDTIGWR